MPFREILLNDGETIPSIAFGSGSVSNGKDVHEYVEQAIEAGFYHLDTAQWYKNEESVGRAIRESGLKRKQLYVTSKYSDARESNPRQALHASLSKLDMTYLDMYLIHSPETIPNYVEVWDQLVGFRLEGRARSIGVSNFGIKELETLRQHSKVTPAVNQIHLHPYNYAKNKALLEYHAEHGIVTEAYGCLAPLTSYPGGPVDKPIRAAAKRLCITPAQVIFLWLKAKGIVIVTSSMEKKDVEDFIAAGDLPPLANEEIEAIEKAGSWGPPKTMAQRAMVILPAIALAGMMSVVWPPLAWTPVLLL